MFIVVFNACQTLGSGSSTDPYPQDVKNILELFQSTVLDLKQGLSLKKEAKLRSSLASSRLGDLHLHWLSNKLSWTTKNEPGAKFTSAELYSHCYNNLIHQYKHSERSRAQYGSPFNHFSGQILFK